MSHITYKIVEHDGGWAYTVDGVFSESFATHAKALAAARRAAAEQRVPGRTEEIQYETADGKWHTETASGSDGGGELDHPVPSRPLPGDRLSVGHFSVLPASSSRRVKPSP